MRNRFLLPVIAVIGLVGAPVAAQLAPIVETAALPTDPFSMGLLEDADGALAPDLWQASSPSTLEFLLDRQPNRPGAPSLGDALKRVLLTSGAGPIGAPDALGGKKLLALARAGFVDEAAEIASLSTIGGGDPWTGQARATSALLNGNIANACSRGESLSNGRDNPFWVRLRVFCYAQAGERDAADLTLGILREQQGVSPVDDVFLAAATTGAAPKSPTPPQTALHYAISKSLGLPISEGLLNEADGGVLVAVVNDETTPLTTRIVAAQRAIAIGVADVSLLRPLLDSASFEVAAIAAAGSALAENPEDPMSDALAYQSVRSMDAPEFIRDRAGRIGDALGLAASFHRAYALSLLYADEIAMMRGVLVAPEVSARFALARMVVGDSVGASEWLQAMLAPGEGVGALPEARGLVFIRLVNLLSILDPALAAQVARRGDVSLINDGAPVFAPSDDQGNGIDPAATARVLEASYDAALGGKAGQAVLSALAASNSGLIAPVRDVVVSQSLLAGGMPVLAKRYAFEQAWAKEFTVDTADAVGDELNPFGPRLKPSAN